MLGVDKSPSITIASVDSVSIWGAPENPCLEEATGASELRELDRRELLARSTIEDEFELEDEDDSRE